MFALVSMTLSITIFPAAFLTAIEMILNFIDGLRGDVHVTFEEGTWSSRLYDLLNPHVTKLVVCDRGEMLC